MRNKKENSENSLDVKFILKSLLFLYTTYKQNIMKEISHLQEKDFFKGTRNIQGLHEGNFKTLLRITREDLEKWSELIPG